MHEFKTKVNVIFYYLKVKNAYMINEIDKVVYDFSMLTLKNLKRFIKYKEDIFITQKL